MEKTTRKESVSANAVSILNLSRPAQRTCVVKENFPKQSSLEALASCSRKSVTATLPFLSSFVLSRGAGDGRKHARNLLGFSRCHPRAHIPGTDMESARNFTISRYKKVEH